MSFTQMFIYALFAIGVFSILIWLFLPGSKSADDPNLTVKDALIDPDDSYQIGLLAGLTKGSIPDAAMMRFALEEFRQKHGRHATTKDIGIVLGLIQAQK